MEAEHMEHSVILLCIMLKLCHWNVFLCGNKLKALIQMRTICMIGWLSTVSRCLYAMLFM